MSRVQKLIERAGRLDAIDSMLDNARSALNKAYIAAIDTEPLDAEVLSSIIQARDLTEKAQKALDR